MPSTRHLFALVVATSFAAGLNIYATVATLGLLARADLVSLPPSLDVLSSYPVIGAALALYLMEFVADKIPLVDLAWNALQTFIRIPAAALLAYGATMRLSPREQLLATAAGSLLALAAHGGKTAARVAVTPSPEPFSNVALSLGEDGLAVFLTWLAGRHPLWATGIVVALVAMIVVFIRAVVRAGRGAFRSAIQYFARDPSPHSRVR
jgi:hypothetical protein